MHGGDKISSDSQNPCSFQSFVGAAELKACWCNLLVDMLYEFKRLSVESLKGKTTKWACLFRLQMRHDTKCWIRAVQNKKRNRNQSKFNKQQ